MSLQSLILLTAISVAGCAVASFVLLAMVYRRHLRREQGRHKKNQADIADMSILFQTMRDIILQQKGLAKNFNKELDHKMGMVKQVLSRGLEKNEALYEKQQRITKQLQESHAQLQSLQRQIAFLKEAVATLGGEVDQKNAASNVVIKKEALSAPPPPEEFEAIEDTPVLKRNLFHEEQETKPDTQQELPIESSQEDSSDVWVSLPTIEEEDPVEEDEASPPAKPEDMASAQEAFRALLDLPAEPTAPAPPPPSEEFGRVLKHKKNGNATGRDAASLRKRVTEYTQAGMSVAEISKELGIGKGEVRLMLSLVQEKHS